MRQEKLRCRSSLGECEVASDNKKCIACRYQKCLNIGMDPMLVQGSRKREGKLEHDVNDEEGDQAQLDCAKTENCDLVESSVTSPYSIFSPTSCKTTTTRTNIPQSKETVSQSPSCSQDTPRSDLPQRPSVIKRAGKDDSAKLQMQAEILKFHGNILTHTGNLFNYHAGLIKKDVNQITETGGELIKQEIKQDFGELSPDLDYLRLKKEESPFPADQFRKEMNYEVSDVLADKIFEEAQELIQNSPWIFEPETLSYVQSPAGEPEISKILTTTTASESVVTSDLRNFTSDQKQSHHRSVIQRK